MVNISSIDISGHSTKREWAVYVISATHITDKLQFLYVGKTGDNRAGCNPIISRIGNHFSYNRIHSQLRNKLKDKSFETTDFTYKIFYATFGAYNESTRNKDKDRINELERRLNKLINTRKKNYMELLNEFQGNGYLNKAEKEKRTSLASAGDIIMIKELSEVATK